MHHPCVNCALFPKRAEFTMIDRIKTYFERQAFGVCEWWAHKLNIKTEQVRLSFIYLSFVTAGLNVVAYLVMAFVLKHKERIKHPLAKRSTVWEL
ncbi:MAG: PspC domain-containing protein [Flavobacteriales bacterium]|jgi:phage shock protein PspC (stress-responsive transcriptional regulator)|nr:PspC domain-containing protein [Flavobacteriales bacterium]MCB0759362.1 PspC domain-containing protein [Flavobacteriales bacterium]